MIKKWTLICVWLVSLMIIVGGMTRITDSGLSITEFELLDGVVPPFTKKAWEKKFNKYQKTSEFKLDEYFELAPLIMINKGRVNGYSPVTTL